MRAFHANAAFLLVTAVVLSILEVPEGVAQDNKLVIEEVIVTAQRREERIHDVPISMSAFDNRFLGEQGVSDLQDVAGFVPNVRIDFAGNQILPRMRGFATLTTVTKGQEMPVGLAVDEIPYGRAEYFQSGLFDVGRVEVLRGPQGQLFGANTTVGLISITTQNPTEEFTGFVKLGGGELDSERIEAGIGGPLIPGFLNFRIAGLTEEQGNYVANTTARIVETADEALGGRERQAVRVKLDFPDLFGGNLLLSYQRDDLDIGPTAREVTFMPDKFRPLIREYDPNADFEPKNFVGSVETPGFGKIDIETFVARGGFDLGAWGFDTVVGWSELKTDLSDDAESTPLPLVNSLVDELSTQTTFEFRVTSPDLPGLFGLESLFGLPLGSMTDFTGGVFFQGRKQDPTNSGSVIDTGLLLTVVAIDSSPIEDEIPIPVRPPSKKESFNTRFVQDSQSVALFGQANWHFTDSWALLLGIRVDQTEKEASWVQTNEPDNAVVVPQLFPEFTDELSRKETQVAPKVGLTFDWTDDANLYVTWSENFQAFGFNNFGASPDPEERRFDSAIVRSWEAGVKTRFLDGAAELNLGFFWMKMMDFQLFTLAPADSFAGLPTTKIVNVGELLAQGAEMDFTWLPTDWLTLRGAVGYNDTEFIEFPIGNCMGDRQNTDGDDDPRCDLAGGPLPQAPKWDINLTPMFHIPFTSIPGLGGLLPAFLEGVDLTSAVTLQYQSEQFLNDTLDPRTLQEAFFRLDGSIGFRSEAQGWSLQLRGKNLTDKTTHNTAFETIPISGGVYKALNPPRALSGEFRWEF